MNTNEIMLSIIVPTYNHELYIEKTIKSIINQKVDFEYEVLIGDDCSTDNTRYVLKKFEKILDSRFKFFYREENYYSNPDKYPYGNSGELKLKSKGKYLIVLEGDDYWIDENKIQRQVQFLESNPEYYGVGHNCFMVDENNQIRENYRYPVLKKKNYDIKALLKRKFPGQTASFMYRNPFLLKNEIINDFLLNTNYGVGDKRTVFYVSSVGKIRIWYDQYLSAYRYVESGGSSFSANMKKFVLGKELKYSTSFMNYCDSKNIKGVHKKVSEYIYYQHIKNKKRKKIISKKEYSDELRRIKSKFFCFITYYYLKIYEKRYSHKSLFMR